jgi:hypothetical protein
MITRLNLTIMSAVEGSAFALHQDAGGPDVAYSVRQMTELNVRR